MQKIPNGPWPAAPPLLTLDFRGSWTNRAGRVDRSACIEIRASELRKLATFHKPARTMVDTGRSVTGSYRESAAEITVTAHHLWMLHRRRLPRQLQGDHRTTKSNAMKRSGEPGRPRPARSTQFERSHHDACRAARDEPPRKSPNPNRGAASTKMLGLWYEWSQTVTIERWRLHQRLAQHFLICPGEPHREAGADERDPGVARCLKLFMVMCTPQESADADLAELWVRQVNAISDRVLRQPMPPEIRGIRARLIERYGVLFRGRKLLCRKCLGIRYGEAKKKERIHRGGAEALRGEGEERNKRFTTEGAEDTEGRRGNKTGGEKKRFTAEDAEDTEKRRGNKTGGEEKEKKIHHRGTESTEGRRGNKKVKRIHRGGAEIAEGRRGNKQGGEEKEKKIHHRGTESTEGRRGNKKVKRIHRGGAEIAEGRGQPLEMKTPDREQGDRGDRGKGDRGKGDRDRRGLDTLEYLARIEQWMRSTKKLNDELLLASSDADDQAALEAAERLLSLSSGGGGRKPPKRLTPGNLEFLVPLATMSAGRGLMLKKTPDPFSSPWRTNVPVPFSSPFSSPHLDYPQPRTSGPISSTIVLTTK